MANDLAHERVVHRVLERQAAKYGDRTFFYFKDKEFSFRDFDRAACRVACGLQKLGIRKGDKVAIMMDNSPEFIFLWFGLSKLGAIEVPINTAHRGNLLTYMLDQSDSCMVALHSHYVDRMGPVLPNTPKIKTAILLDKPGSPSVEVQSAVSGVDRTLFEGQAARLGKQVLDWSQIVDNDGGYRTEEVLWSDPLAIMYTSGTTGPSKGSLWPQNFGIYMAEIVIDCTDIVESDCLHNCLPLFHGLAQVLVTVPALLTGARMLLTERFSPNTFWDEVRRYGCTEASYVGAVMPMLFKAERKPDDADNPLRVFMGGGVPNEIYEPFERRFGVRIAQAYGTSESGLPLNNPASTRKVGTSGRPRQDCVVKIVDDDGLEVGPNIPGEMLIRPLKPYSMLLEYYNMPEKTVEAWRDLWFHTGDYLFYDDEGYYHFFDRKKDYLRRRGENISSFEVEQAINSHPAVLESAAIGVKSDLGEDEVMACVVLKPGQNVTAVELTDYFAGRMAYFMVPRYIRLMAGLPKTPTERIQKYKLRDEGITQDTWDREKAGYKLKR